jgi:hypothetical protein
MAVYFDLWSYADVKKHAALIHQRLEAGDMPCDAPWTPHRVQLFQSWIDAGYPE